MKKTVPFLFFILSVFLFISCQKSIIFDKTVSFPNNNWAFENKAITFETPLKSSEKPHAIVIELDIIGTPNVDMFYTYITMISPQGAKTIKTVLFNFLNPQEPYIKGNAPNEKIYRMMVYPKKYFSETGTYTFIVDQYSNKADNYGIRSLRMYIEKGEKGK